MTCEDGQGPAGRDPANEESLIAELARVRESLDTVNGALVAVAAADATAKAAALQDLAQARASVDWTFPTRLVPLVNAEPALAASYAGPIEKLLIDVRRADEEWPADDAEQDAKVTAAAGTAPHVADALRQTHLLLLPRKLTEQLESKPVAGAVALDGLFPDDVDRAGAVKLLAERSQAFPGVVDGERGVAYRTARTGGEKLLYLAAPLVAFAAGALLVWVLGHLDEWTSIEIDQLKSTRHLLEVYALVTVGALLHLGVAVSKLHKQTDEGAVVVPAEVLDWAHVRAMNLCVLIGPIIVATLFVRMTNLRIEGTEDWAVALLAGYSSDSVGQLAFARLNTAVEVFAAKTSPTAASQ